MNLQTATQLLTSAAVIIVSVSVVILARRVGRLERLAAAEFQRDRIPPLRAAVAAGAGHACDEWLDADGRCRLCDRVLDARRDVH